MVSNSCLLKGGKFKFWKYCLIHFVKIFTFSFANFTFKIISTLFIFLSLTTNSIFATNYHITVNGKSIGDGSRNNPWDLATGISGRYGAPGDTLWLHGGVYNGRYVSRIKGNSSNLIVLAQYPGETAIIDGNTGQSGVTTLDILGSYAVYYGFQVMSSSTKRVTNQSGGAPTDINHGHGIGVMGTSNKLINLIIRDVTGTGIGFWKSATNSEIYGCIIYNNGWQGSDRGHGPGIYSQNETGIKHIKDNIMFGGFGRGIQIYGVNGGLKGFNIEGNTIFNSGSLAKTASWNIIIGGETAADNITLKDNYVYKSFLLNGVNVQVHYGNTLNGSISLQNNRFVGGDPVLSLKDWQKASFTGNSIFGKSRIVDFSAQSAYIGSYVWNNNNYNTVNSTNSMDGFTFENWKKYTGFDGTSRFGTSNPANEIIVKPNHYEKGSGNIIILNNQQSSSVEVDLSKILTLGAEYEIKDVENYMGQPLISGKYNGAKILLPMNLTTTDKPAGISSITHSDSRFGVFVVRTKGVTINPPVVIINKPPTLNAINDPAAINEDAVMQTINLSGISSGGEDQTLAVSAISDNVTLIPHPNVNYTSPQSTGSITFKPAANRWGTAKITVMVNDGGTSNNIISRTFNVVVNPVNDPPTLNVLNNLSVEGNSGTHTINLSGIGAGPFESQKIFVSATSNNLELIPNPIISYTSPNNTGTLKFTPSTGKSGTAIITVKLADDGLNTVPHINTITKTFNITVGEIVNKPPTLNPINNPLAINEDALQQTINLSGITAGLGESQTLRVTATSDNTALIPNPIVLYTSPNTTGTIKYTPVANKSGIANITVKVEDGGAANNFTIQNFKVIVNEINDAPQVNSVPNLTIAANSPAKTINLSGINAGPFENQVLTVSATSNNTGLIPNPIVNYSSPSTAGTLTVTPAAGKSGLAIITLTITDNGSGTTPHINTFKRTFTINVDPPEVVINKQPTLNIISDPAAINEDAPQQIIDLTGISAGEGENQTLNITATSDNLDLIPHPGVQYNSPNTTGAIKYLPVVNRSGIANITVKVDDGGAENNIITRIFKVVVNEINDAPQFNVINNISISANSPVKSISLAGINAGPFENQEISLSATSSNPDLISNPIINYTSPSTSGSLSFQPEPGKNGSAIITVTITDSGPGSAPHVNTFKRTFIINVTSPEVHVNKQPTLNLISDPVAINEDALQQTVQISGITAGEGETQNLTITAFSDDISLIPHPAVQYTSPNATGTITYMPVANKSGIANITVMVEDGGEENESITRTFKVVVNEVNDAPQMNVIENFAIPANLNSRTINVTGINAGPYETQSLTVTATSSNPGLIPNPEVSYDSPATSGTLTVKPVSGNHGIANVTVTVTDNGSGDAPHVNSYSRTFNITVDEPAVAINKKPTLDHIENPAALTENSQVQTVNLTGISAGEGETQTLKITATSDNKWLIPNPTIHYKSPNTTGTLNFTPIPKRSGVANIIVTVDDGALENNIISRTFKVTIIDINDAPQINIISDVFLPFNSSARTIDLTGINAGNTESQNISVTATSSNLDLIPNPEIDYSSPSSFGFLTLNPVAEGSGTSLITVTVNDDGPGEAPHINTFSRTFTVTVTENESANTEISLELINMMDGIVVYELTDGLEIDIKNLPPNLEQLNIRAVTNSDYVGSIIFDFNGIKNFNIDEDAPYEIADNKNKNKWNGLKVGDYTVSATLSLDKKGKEKLEKNHTVSFKIIQSESDPTVNSLTRTYGFNKNYNFRKEDFNTAFVDNKGQNLRTVRIISLPYDGNLELNGMAVNPGTEISLQEIEHLVYIPKDKSEEEDSFIWSGSNGKKYASNVASVKLIPAKELNESFEFKVAKFYPNPVQDQLAIEFISPKENNVNIYITDAQGQLRKSYNSMASEGENQIKLETYDLNSGMYMVTIVNDFHTQTFKIIKGK